MQSVEELNFLVKMGSITESEADRVLELVVDRVRENRLDLERRHGLEKDAATPGFSPWPYVLSGLVGSAALTGLGIGTHYLTEYLDEKKEEKKMDEAFEMMKKVNPDIKNVPLPQQRQSFSVLKSVSPTIAKNPVLAANFVQRQAANYGGAGFEEAANLARAEAAMAPRTLGVGQQISSQLISQGIGSVANSLGTFTRKGIELGLEDPVRIGEARARATKAELDMLSKLDLDPAQREMEMARAKEHGKQIGREFGMVEAARELSKDPNAYMDYARIRGQNELNKDIEAAKQYHGMRTEYESIKRDKSLSAKEQAAKRESHPMEALKSYLGRTGWASGKKNK